MFLKDAKTGDLVRVCDLHALFDPHEDTVKVRYQAGEEQGDPVEVAKSDFAFPSGEPLPKCWLDPHYRMRF